MSRTFGVIAFLLLSAAPLWAAEFYVDPVRGDGANDGSAARPWKSLQEVVDAGLIEGRKWESIPYKEGARLVPKNAGAPVKEGDTIWLRTGDYGDLQITGHYNADFVTIAAAEGSTPRFHSVHLRSCSHWALVGLHVSPEFGSGKRPRTLIDLESHGWQGPIHDIRVEKCVVRSAEDTSQWSKEDWNQRACTGIDADGERITIRGNRLTNVDFGISAGGSHALVEHNEVVNFAGDGLRGLGDYGVFQYNLVKNCYDVNANHDDGFQSWSTGPGGVGTGQVVGVVLRGNTIINYEDPKQPHRGTLQGIGCFDGMFVDWVVENNLVVVDHYHGITLGGARDCRIVNNTVIDLNADRPGPPWIRVGKHKKGMISSGCTIRNNLARLVSADEGREMTIDHNLQFRDAAEIFVDAAAGDFRLKPGSPAIDAAAAELAPEVDIAGTRRPQGAAVDVGAYEAGSD